MSVNNKDILQVQVGFNWLLSHLLICPLICKAFPMAQTIKHVYGTSCKHMHFCGLGDMLDITHMIPFDVWFQNMILSVFLHLYGCNCCLHSNFSLSLLATLLRSYMH